MNKSPTQDIVLHRLDAQNLGTINSKHNEESPNNDSLGGEKQEGGKS
jgi:hypothetical protein